MNDQASFAGTAARTPVGELQSGQAVDGPYCCSEKTTATDRNGKTPPKTPSASPSATSS
jgi:hypothetical protein